MIKKCFFLGAAYLALFVTHTSAHLAPEYKKKPCSSASQKRAVSQFLLRKKGTICITIPKCGTHLLIKCLDLLKINGISYRYESTKYPSPERLEEIRQLNKLPPPNHYKGPFYTPIEGPIPKNLTNILLSAHVKKSFWTHWPHTKEFEQVLEKTTYANFLIIRDPRDMLVSYAHMLHKNKDNGLVIDIEKIMLDLITGKQENYVPWGVEIQDLYPIIWEKGLYNFYMMYLPWLRASNFCLIKFENLVGSAGGGSDIAQLNEIIKIGNHLGSTVSAEKARNVVSQLFGGTWSFREGKIGSWKQHFTPAIKEAFKNDKNLLRLLQLLGYENGTDW